MVERRHKLKLIRIYLKIKLVFRDRMTSFAIIVSSFIFLLLFLQLSINVEEKSSIPIGVLNLDHSESGAELLAKIKTNPAFYVYEEKESKLRELLLKETIEVYFVIEQGYQENIMKGIHKEIVTMSYLKGNESSKILADIFAGEMIQTISTYKSFLAYERWIQTQSLESDQESTLQNKKNYLSFEKYLSYIETRSLSSDFDFAFDFHYLESDTEEVFGEKVQNSILYQMFMLGILCMVISFLIMFLCSSIIVQERVLGITQRIRLVSNGFYTHMDYSSITCIVTGVLSSMALFLLGTYSVFATNEFYLFSFILFMLYIVVVSEELYLVANITGGFGSYQLLGIVIILGQGILGFLWILQEFMPKFLIKIIKFTPNGWFIEGFTDIIFHNQGNGVSKDSFIQLLVTALVLLTFNICLEKTLVEKSKNKDGIGDQYES